MKKGTLVPLTIDGYISGFPGDVQVLLEKFRQTIRKAAPGAVEAIVYRMPTFRLNGNLVHFAAFKKHIGFYPTPSGIVDFKKELTSYATSKGAIQFPLHRPVPYALIGRIVKFRVKESVSKAGTTRRKG